MMAAENVPCSGGCGKVRSILYSDSPKQWLCYTCAQKKKPATDRARLHDALDAVLDGARARDAESSIIYVNTARELKRVMGVLRTSYLAIIPEAGQASNGKFGCRALVSRNTALKAVKEAGATTAKVTPG